MAFDDTLGFMNVPVGRRPSEVQERLDHLLSNRIIVDVTDADLSGLGTEDI